MAHSGAGLSSPKREENMRRVTIVLIVLAALLMLAGCVPGVNELTNTPTEQGMTAGFLRGLWNGFVSPLTFIISLFNKNVQIYEVHNNGGWYNFGFILGAMIIFGGGSRGGRYGRKRRRE